MQDNITTTGLGAQVAQASRPDSCRGCALCPASRLAARSVLVPDGLQGRDWHDAYRARAAVEEILRSPAATGSMPNRGNACAPERKSERPFRQLTPGIENLCDFSFGGVMTVAASMNRTRPPRP